MPFRRRAVGLPSPAPRTATCSSTDGANYHSMALLSPAFWCRLCHYHCIWPHGTLSCVNGRIPAAAVPRRQPCPHTVFGCPVLTPTQSPCMCTIHSVRAGNRFGNHCPYHSFVRRLHCPFTTDVEFTKAALQTVPLWGGGRDACLAEGLACVWLHPSCRERCFLFPCCPPFPPFCVAAAACVTASVATSAPSRVALNGMTTAPQHRLQDYSARRCCSSPDLITCRRTHT